MGRRRDRSERAGHHAQGLCHRRERERAGAFPAGRARGDPELTCLVLVLLFGARPMISFRYRDRMCLFPRMLVVQATLYKMAQQIISENAGVQDITYTLPNKHYVPVDMKYIGVDNTTPAKAEVFVPLAAPSGLISATISRK